MAFVVNAQSWRELLLDLKARGLALAPSLATGDGGMGFWAALREVFPLTAQQRCWVHKTANVLNKLPKSVSAKAKADLQNIWMAETRKQADKAFDLFTDKYGAKYEKAVACLMKDREPLLRFYDFPAEHWRHLRATLTKTPPEKPNHQNSRFAPRSNNAGNLEHLESGAIISPPSLLACLPPTW
jgi:transposase-like protein